MPVGGQGGITHKRNAKREGTLSDGVGQGEFGEGGGWGVEAAVANCGFGEMAVSGRAGGPEIQLRSPQKTEAGGVRAHRTQRIRGPGNVRAAQRRGAGANAVAKDAVSQTG